MLCVKKREKGSVCVGEYCRCVHMFQNELPSLTIVLELEQKVEYYSYIVLDSNLDLKAYV